MCIELIFRMRIHKLTFLIWSLCKWRRLLLLLLISTLGEWPRRARLTRKYPRGSLSTPSGSAGSRGETLKHHGSVLIAFIKRSVINLPAIRHHPRLKHGPPVKRLVLGASTLSVVTSGNCIYYFFPPYCHFFSPLHATWDLNLKCQQLAYTSHLINPNIPVEAKTPSVSNKKTNFQETRWRSLALKFSHLSAAPGE